MTVLDFYGLHVTETMRLYLKHLPIYYLMPQKGKSGPMNIHNGLAADRS